MMKIKILHILTELQLTNGVTSYVMNHYERLNHEEFEVDFLIVGKADQKYIEMIEKNQDRIIYGIEPKVKNYKLMKNHAKKLFDEKIYDIIHSHVFNWSVPYLKEAKKRGIKIRILHAHATQSSPSLIKRIRNGLLIPKALSFANQYWSCSKVAGDFFFKDKPYYLSHNAINAEKFLFNEENRSDIRQLLNIGNDKKVIGFFGRFDDQKNPLFILKVFQEIVKKDSNIYLLMVGSGKREAEILKCIDKENLKRNVIVFSPRRDIYKFYSAIDLLFLPSLYEGLPVVGVEALFSNLPQLYSTHITKEINLLKSISYVDLSLPIDNWVNKAIELLNKDVIRFTKIDERLSIYDIQNSAKIVGNKYKELIKNEI